FHDGDLSDLCTYCETVASACGVGLPHDYPVFGRDAFRTATGVHAAAIVKAQSKGDSWLADLVYSGVPAAMFGRCQEIEVGHMSGLSNVKFWLRARGYDAEDADLCERILAAAKATDHTLSEDEVVSIIGSGVGR
ncbi:MAG: 2-isopropylmalate synthase, partial [Gemmatimonadetes bacterium]|nr:2-isopropylmalate synthase [Gemmatimonadota bacterium]